MAATTEVPIENEAVTPSEPRTRLDFIDGLRALAALYVVFGHVAQTVADDPTTGPLSRAVSWLMSRFLHAEYAVMLFIVLSGFCLMLPVARSTDGTVRGGLRRFFAKRARRILPPYYCALLFSLLLILAVPEMNRFTGSGWDAALPAFKPIVLGSHMLLLHDLFSQASTKIDPPMWSIAVEWHIYFVFPLLLLPVWRRLGSAGMTVFGIILGWAVHAVTHGRYDFSHPEYIGLFAAGAAAASIALGLRPTGRRPWLWLVSGIGALLANALVARAFPHFYAHHSVMGNTAFGLFVAAILVWLLSEPRSWLGRTVHKVLETKRLVAVGLFSYTLYLFHAPMLAAAFVPIRASRLTGDARWLLLAAVVAPIVILATYGIHLIVEKPFMSLPPATRSRVNTNSPIRY